MPKTRDDRAFSPELTSACPDRLRRDRDDVVGRRRAPDRPARIPAPGRRAVDRGVPPHAVVRVEPGPRCTHVPVPALDDQHVSRQRHPLQQLVAHDSGRRADADAAVDHRDAACAVRARARGSRLVHVAVELRVRLRRHPAPAALAAPELSRPAPLDPIPGADAYEVWLVDTGKTEFVRTNVLDEREFYTLPSVGAVDRHGALARARTPRRPVQPARERLPGGSHGAWSPCTARRTRRCRTASCS